MEIDTKMVITVGDQDPFGAQERAFRLKEELPHAKLRVILGIGHMIPQLHPDLVMEAAREVTDMQNQAGVQQKTAMEKYPKWNQNKDAPDARMYAIIMTN